MPPPRASALSAGSLALVPCALLFLVGWPRFGRTWFLCGATALFVVGVVQLLSVVAVGGGDTGGWGLEPAFWIALAFCAIAVSIWRRPDHERRVLTVAALGIVLVAFDALVGLFGFEGEPFDDEIGFVLVPGLVFAFGLWRYADPR